MARRGRTGSLTTKTYFPRTGDTLDIKGCNDVYHCVRQNNVVFRGTTIRYCLLAATNPDWGSTAIYITFHDDNDSALKEFLKTVEKITRPRSKGEGSITYVYQRSSGSFLQCEE